MIRVGIFGRGRLGALVAQELAAWSAFELVWQVGRDETDLEGAKLEQVDVALDVSVGAAVSAHLRWADRSGSNLVIGATAWDEAVAARYAQPDSPIGVMVAPNFSFGMALTERLARVLGGWQRLNHQRGWDAELDIGIVEHHHRKKLDAPSGSAKLLARATAAEGVSIASLRCGRTVGYHELRCEGTRETLVLSHNVHERGVFASGAVEALQWMVGKRGLFRFSDLCDDYFAELLAGFCSAPGGVSAGAPMDRPLAFSTNERTTR